MASSATPGAGAGTETTVQAPASEPSADQKPAAKPVAPIPPGTPTPTPKARAPRPTLPGVLPGVLPDDDGPDIGVEAAQRAKDAARRAAKPITKPGEKPTDAKTDGTPGKEAAAKKEGDEQVEGEQKPEGEAKPTSKVDENGKPYWWAKEWNSEEEAIKAAQTMRGMHKRLEKDKSDAIAEQRKAATAVWELTETVKNLESRLAAVVAGRPDPSAAEGDGTVQPPGVGAEAKPGQQQHQQQVAKALEDRIYEDIEWDQFEHVVQTHGAKAALIWAFHNHSLLIKDEINRLIEEKAGDVIKGRQESTRAQQFHDQATELFQAAMTHVVDGVAQYPELQDSEAAQMVGYIWGQLGFTDKERMTARALHTAVLAYRNQFGWPPELMKPAGAGRTTRAAATGNPTPQPPANPAAVAAATAAVQALEDGANAGANGVPGPSGAPVVRPAGNPREESRQRVKQAIRGSSAYIGTLGFTD